MKDIIGPAPLEAMKFFFSPSFLPRHSTAVLAAQCGPRMIYNLSTSKLHPPQSGAYTTYVTGLKHSDKIRPAFYSKAYKNWK